MGISIKTIILFTAVVLTGLSAGLFFAWSVSVIPGTQKVMDSTYLQTMQSINRAILNPAFYLVFFGSLVFLTIASIYQLHDNKVTFWLMLAASVLYLTGTLGVTGLGNVPLNNQLETLNLIELPAKKLAEFRKSYESNWNRLHWIRTIFAVASFLLASLAVFFHVNNNQHN